MPFECRVRPSDTKGVDCFKADANSCRDPTCSRSLMISTATAATQPQSVVATHRDAHHAPPPMHQSLADEPITRNHVAQILFTSGTTAEPRGVVLTHGNFLANLEPLESGIAPYRKYERWFHPLRFVTLIPLSHVFGQFMALCVPPLLGAAGVFEVSPNAAA